MRLNFSARGLGHTLIANGGYPKDTAETELEKGIAKLISFGVAFLANPDLPGRFESGAALNEADRNMMFGGGIKDTRIIPSWIKHKTAQLMIS